MLPQIGELKQDIKMLEDTVSKRDTKIQEMEQILEKERGEKGDVHGILRARESQIEGLDAKVRGYFVSEILVCSMSLTSMSLTRCRY